MRTRNLKPGFFKDADLGRLSLAARLLYQGLWCLADRRGICEDHPMTLKAELFPWDDVDVDDLLDELAAPRQYAEGGFILRYQVEGRRYLKVLNLHRHQHFHPKETARKDLPDPPGEGDSEPVVGRGQATGQPLADHRPAGGKQGADHGPDTGQQGASPSEHQDLLGPSEQHPPQPPPRRARGEPDGERPQLRIAARIRKSRHRSDAAELEAYAGDELGLRTDAELRRRIREALRSGVPPATIRLELEAMAGKAEPAEQARAPDPPESHVVASQVWSDALRRLEPDVDRHRFATWLRPTEGWGLDGGCLSVAVPSTQFRDHLAGSLDLGPMMLKAAHKACVDVCTVEFLVAEPLQ